MTKGITAINQRPGNRIVWALLIALLPAPAAWTGDTFARVGKTEITYDDFEQEVVMAARQTYYHGRPASAEAFVEFRKSVADDLIDRHLLLREAERRAIEPVPGPIEKRLDAYEQRYGNTARWQAEGAQMLAALRERFEQDSVIEILERDVRATPPPTDPQLREFYAANPDSFTEPQQRRLSVIVLSVEPSATPATWAAARAEADRIVDRIRGGTDFSELARLHSSDVSVRQGGDMGYLHEGMLSAAAETAIHDLSVGDLSEPVTVLEGIAIFQLTDRKPEALRPFAEITNRAADLWARHTGERQWDSMLSALRGSDDVFIDAAYLVSAPTAR